MVSSVREEKPYQILGWNYSQYLFDVYSQDVLLSTLLVGLVTLMIWTYRRRRPSGYPAKNPREHRKYIPNHVPPVLPNGWIPVLESSKLKINMVKTLNIVGLDLVAFRTEDGVAHVLDAFCPHLGAHLGVMGRVVGDCIECPFHGWRFRGKDGACTHVPYASKTPEFVKAKTWPCREYFPFIFVWHHAEGDAPSWEMPESAVAPGAPWKVVARFERTVGAHCQDVAENVADFGHISHIHVPSSLLSGEEYFDAQGNCWKGRLLQHSYKPSWFESGTSSSLEMEITSKLLGRELQFLHIKGSFRTTGPAFFHSNVSVGKWRYYSCMSMTPTGPFTVDLVHYLFTEPNVPWIVGQLAHRGLINMIDRDIVMWHKKAYHHRPALVEEDKTIVAFRRWYSQFYSQNSPTWRDIKDNTLEW